MKKIGTIALSVAGLWVGAAAFGGTVQIEPSRDNTLYESATGALSNGAGFHLFAGRTAQPELRRGLLAFDVAGNVPAGATITGASLTLNLSKAISGALPVSLHRVLGDWGEGTADAPGEEGIGAPAAGGDATWLHTFSPSDFWLTPGGDFDPVPSSTTAVGSTFGPYTWDATPEMLADLEAWLNDPATNYGWLLLGDEVTLASAKRFDSRESSVPPVLTVHFDEANAVPALSPAGVLLAALLLLAASAALRRRQAGSTS